MELDDATRDAISAANTLVQLKGIIQRLPAPIVPPGKTLVLYSGLSQNSGVDLQEWATSENYYLINFTARAEVLDSAEFTLRYRELLATELAQGGVSDPDELTKLINEAAGDQLYGTKPDSMWAALSIELVSSATGEILTVSPARNTTKNRVFAMNEIPAILVSGKAISMNGVSIDELKKLQEGCSPEEGLRKVFDLMCKESIEAIRRGERGLQLQEQLATGEIYGSSYRDVELEADKHDPEHLKFCEEQTERQRMRQEWAEALARALST